MDDIHSVQVLVHLAPLAFEMSPSLSPFALWPALPASDYYGDSVTMGLAPVRPSRVPFGVERIERDLGVPFIPFNEVVPHRLASRRWPPAKPNGWPLVALRSDAVAASVRFHRWRLRFRQCSFRPITRVLRDGTFSVFQ